MNLEKNVALYEEIFHALSGGWAFVRRPSLRGARMRWGLDIMGGNSLWNVRSSSGDRALLCRLYGFNMNESI